LKIKAFVTVILIFAMIVGMVMAVPAGVYVDETYYCYPEILFMVRPQPVASECGWRIHSENFSDADSPGETLVTITMGGEHRGRTISGESRCNDYITTEHPEDVNIYLTFDSSETRYISVHRPRRGALYATITPPPGWTVIGASTQTYRPEMGMGIVDRWDRMSGAYYTISLRRGNPIGRVEWYIAPLTTPEEELPATMQPAADIEIILNGNLLALDVTPQIVDGRILVPFRELFEALGARVELQIDGRVVGSKNRTLIALLRGETRPMINNIRVPLDAPSIVVVDRQTLVPLRFVAENFGAEVNWNAETRVIMIKSG